MIFDTKPVRIVFLVFLISIISFGQVRLPKLISDGMVLQREAEIKIWGWAAKEEKVSVNFIDSTYRTVADNNGEWIISLPELKAGGPYEMQINAGNEITIKDILIGDVWVCSGQSNMGFIMQDASSIYETEIANSTNKYIRHFSVPIKYDFNTQHKDLGSGFPGSGLWQSADSQTVRRFSAVAYFFAKELYNKYKIPIGLINASLGGSAAESWMSEDALKQFPNLYDEAQKFKDSSLITRIQNEDRNRISEWYRLSTKNDQGYKDPQNAWYKPEINTSGWDEMKVPGFWADGKLGEVNGVVWFRRDFEVPSSMIGTPGKLILGRIVDADSVFINGVFVGSVGFQYPPRKYDIPSGFLKEGKNNMVVRIINNSGKGGFVPDKPYELIVGTGKVDLKGIWKYRLGNKMEPLAGQTFVMWKPSGLYNGMISPLLNYSIKGVIWYQGESNTTRAVEYRDLFPALIKNWRDKWNQGEFPFLFVQLPNFMEPKNEPYESEWALFREAQLKTLSVPNTAMAVTIDVGEWNDIHPLNKKDVGERLSLTAQKLALGDNNVVCSGPLYESMKIKKNKIILTFKNTGSGLMAKGSKELKYFSIAGEDRKFVWAEAKIENNRVIVWSDKITNPIAVRYAWADDPEGANLYNKEGLPASPFRTDDFQ